MARHAGAQRDNRPAWMTKGLGVGTEMFGEATGELMKPGLTKADMEAIEKKGFEGPDPFGEIFNERKTGSLPPGPVAAHLQRPMGKMPQGHGRRCHRRTSFLQLGTAALYLRDLLALSRDSPPPCRGWAWLQPLLRHRCVRVSLASPDSVA